MEKINKCFSFIVLHSVENESSGNEFIIHPQQKRKIFVEVPDKNGMLRTSIKIVMSYSLLTMILPF